MKLTDYLIDQSGKDWAEMLRPWCPPLPPSFTIWLVNRFGDVFAVFDDGSVNMLDVGLGSLTRVAEDRDDFANKIDIDDNCNDWLMAPLVDRCVEAGLILASDQCFSYKTPPVLGGEYSVGNFFVVDIAKHYGFLADIFRQTKDLPDGTGVQIVVANVPKQATEGG